MFKGSSGRVGRHGRVEYFLSMREETEISGTTNEEQGSFFKAHRWV